MADDVLALRTALWVNGYRPVAVLTRGKAPAGVDWIVRARQDMPFAACHPSAPRTASTGVLCDGLRAIDIDVPDPALASQIEALAFKLLGGTLIRERDGTGKRLLVYRAAEGEPSKRFVGLKGGNLVEVLGHGQQFVAFGVHVDGMDYRWRDGRDLLGLEIAGVLAVTEDDIAAFLDAVAVILGAPNEVEREDAKAKPVAMAALPVPASGAPSSKRLEAYANTTLQRVALELAGMGKGGRNDALNKAAMRAGGLAARGWLVQADCQAQLRNACHSNGLIKEDGHRAFNATFASGFKAGLVNPARDPENTVAVDDRLVSIGLGVRELVMHGADLVDAKTGEVVEAAAVEDDSEEIAAIAPLADHLTHAPGVLGRLTGWIADSGTTGNRRLAMGAALSLMSMLLGRSMAAPNGGSLELYIISTFPTGGGKGHQAHALTQLIKRMGLTKQHLGPSKFASGSALDKDLVEKRLLLCVQDEYAEILAGITDPRASAHVEQISASMRKLWGNNFADYTTASAMTRSTETVSAPHLVIYGMTTADALFRAVKGKDITNGLINRHLLMDGGEEAGKVRATADLLHPPAHLLQDLQAIYRMGVSTTGGNMRDAICKGNAHEPSPVPVAWGTRAEDAFEAFENGCKARMREDMDIGRIFVRTAFMALKLATIRACGRNMASPVVDLEDVEWGAAVAWQSAEHFYTEIKRNMVDPLSFPELVRKIEECLRRARFDDLPVRAMRRNALFNNLKRHMSRASDFSSTLKEMEASQIIETMRIGKKIVVRLVPRRG